jgi:hypothetical protein
MPAWLPALVEATREDAVWTEPEWGEGDDLYGDLPLSPAASAEADATLTNRVRVGDTPALQCSGLEIVGGLWVDPDAPDELLLSFSAEHPPFLWVPVGRDASSLRRALRSYFTRGGAGETTKTSRLLLGLRSGGLPSLEDIERHFVMQPFCDHHSVVPGSFHAQKNDAYGAVSSVMTMHSRSRLSIEDSPQCAVVDIAYRPMPDERVVARANERFGWDMPLDVPADVVAALLGFSCNSARQWLEPDPRTEDDPQAVAGALSVLYYMDEPSLPELLRDLASHPSEVVRDTVSELQRAMR